MSPANVPTAANSATIIKKGSAAFGQVSSPKTNNQKMAAPAITTKTPTAAETARQGSRKTSG